MGTGDAEGANQPLLLHSLEEFSDLILEWLELAGVRTIVEIGSEGGGMTRKLARWAEDRRGHLYAIEPAPVPEVVELDEQSESFDLVKGLSPDALEGVPPCEGYIVDGDHNHWVVTRELAAMYADDRAPITILHDVGWPWARRDLYYAPHALPPEGVHPHSWELGNTLDRPELVEGGFRGPLDFASSLTQGGPRNGVLAAIEDFLSTRTDLAYRHIPAIFGVGVIFPAEAPYATDLKRVLDPLHENELLDKLERNRIRLYLHVLEMQDARQPLDSARNRLVAEYDARLSELEAENARLRQEAVSLRMERAAQP